MSSRSSTKRTTMTSSSTSATVGSSSSQSHSRSSSPLSPTRISRLQEKNDLSNLNDRLAIYIDKVRHLENENGRLTREIRTFEETKSREVTSVKSMFEGELAEARRLLDELSKEKAKLELDIRRLFADNEDLNNRLAKTTEDLLLAESSVSTLEARLADVQKSFNVAQSERKKLSDENKRLTIENTSLSAQLNEHKKMAEEEILKRVEAENLLQTTKEDLDFRDKVYKKQIFEMEKNKKVEISEIDGRLNHEYEEKLYAMLQEVRGQFEDQLRQTKLEASQLYEDKIKNLERQLLRSSNNSATAVEEMRKMSSRLEESQRKISDLEQSNASLAIQLRELEKQLENERARHLAEYNRQEREINRLHEDMQQRMQEYQDLMDIKVQLDLEIAQFRNLIESEEKRLNITPVSGTPGRPANVSSRQTPRRGTPMRVGAKRKRTVLEDSEASSEDGYTVYTEYQTDLQIVNVDVQGKFINLENKGDKDLVVGKWQLIATTAEGQTCTYKFRANTKVKAGEQVTVWSTDAGQDHDPPHHLVMSEQQWAISDQMKIQLINAVGEEVGLLERKHTHSSSSIIRSRQGVGELYHQQADGEGGDKCAIM